MLEIFTRHRALAIPASMFLNGRSSRNDVLALYLDQQRRGGNPGEQAQAMAAGRLQINCRKKNVAKIPLRKEIMARIFIGHSQLYRLRSQHVLT